MVLELEVIVNMEELAAQLTYEMNIVAECSFHNRNYAPHGSENINIYLLQLQQFLMLGKLSQTF